MAEPTPSSINHDPAPHPQPDRPPETPPASNGCVERWVHPSATRATVGRILLVHAAHLQCPSPGIVVGVNDNGSVMVNVFVNGRGDPAALANVRASASGNTMGPIAVYDALDEGQRRFLIDHLNIALWAEWMPYQVGQAKKTDEVTDTLRVMLADIDRRLSAVECHFTPPSGSN